VCPKCKRDITVGVESTDQTRAILDNGSTIGHPKVGHVLGRNKPSAILIIVGGAALLLYFVVIAVQDQSDPAETSRRLYLKGRYNDVISRYPSTSYADSVRCRKADSLFRRAEYLRILSDYPQCRWCCSSARESIAVQLYVASKYDRILTEYSNTTYADSAREALAKLLYAKRKYEEVLASFPSTRVACDVKNYHPEIAKRIEDKKNREAAKQRAINQKNERNRRSLCRSQPSNCLKLGMRQNEVIDLMGRPNDINRSVFSALGTQHVNEQWVYNSESNYYSKAVYVYFDDGVLQSWQE
jgi:hypothetical protein